MGSRLPWTVCYLAIHNQVGGGPLPLRPWDHPPGLRTTHPQGLGSPPGLKTMPWDRGQGHRTEDRAQEEGFRHCGMAHEVGPMSCGLVLWSCPALLLVAYCGSSCLLLVRSSRLVSRWLAWPSAHPRVMGPGMDRSSHAGLIDYLDTMGVKLGWRRGCRHPSQLALCMHPPRLTLSTACLAMCWLLARIPTKLSSRHHCPCTGTCTASMSSASPLGSGILDACAGLDCLPMSVMCYFITCCCNSVRLFCAHASSHFRPARVCVCAHGCVAYGWALGQIAATVQASTTSSLSSSVLKARLPPSLSELL